MDVQFKGRTGIREGLQPALDAGTNIDLFDEDIDRVNTTWGAYLMDLEELAKASDYDATANASLMEACREVGGGTLKSIPYQPNVFAFFYNKAIFEEAAWPLFPPPGRNWTQHARRSRTQATRLLHVTTHTYFVSSDTICPDSTAMTRHRIL